MINAQGASGSALISALPDSPAGSSSTRAPCPSRIIGSNANAGIPRDHNDIHVSTEQQGTWSGIRVVREGGAEWSLTR